MTIKGSSASGRRPDCRAVGIITGLIYAIALLSVAIPPLTAAFLSQYDYPHAWVSAHFSVIGRSFLEQGVLALNGTPIQNNAPLTAAPDAYLNWPPLYPVLLSYIYAVFGETERVHHVLAALINLGIAGLVFQFVRRAAGPMVAATAIIVFLNLPIVAKYGHVGMQLHLAILLCVGCLYCFVLSTHDEVTEPQARRRHAILGGVLMFAGVMTSWEPSLAVLGLLAVALLRRDWTAYRLALIYGIVATVAVVFVFSVYAISYPYFLEAIFERALFRTGLISTDYESRMAAISPHLIQEANTAYHAMNIVKYVATVFVPRLNLLGPFGLVAVALAVLLPIVRDAVAVPRWTYMVFGLLSVYLVWAVALRQHNQIHEYQILLMAPAAAVASGFVLFALGRELTGCEATSPRRTIFVATCLAIGIAAFIGRSPNTLQLYWAYQPASDPLIQFGRAIEKAVEPDAIVVHTENSMVPVYYAHRHIIRGVHNETVLGTYRTAIEELCPDCPIYMAIQDGREDGFRTLLRNTAQRTDTPYGTLVRMKPAR